MVLTTVCPWDVAISVQSGEKSSIVSLKNDNKKGAGCVYMRRKKIYDESAQETC